MKPEDFTNTTTTGTGTVSSYTNYCAHRLPCGLCRLMMTSCPLFTGCGVQWDITDGLGNKYVAET